MTTLEQRYMETVPLALRNIVNSLEASRTRLVKINSITFVNPTEISTIHCLREKNTDKEYGGRVSITMRNSEVYETFFKSADEAIKALGLGD